MHQARNKVSMKWPLPRKGTKYVARAASHPEQGLPVVVAIRDILGLAKTSSEVKKMINLKMLKINGRDVKDLKESVKLFNIIEADKKYILSFNNYGKFIFEETKDNSRIVGVLGKKTLSGKKTQLNLHDGSNIISKEKINIGDSLELGFDGKVSKIIPLEKGKNVFVISGKSIGQKGKVLAVENGEVKVKFEDKEVDLHKSHLIVR